MKYNFDEMINRRGSGSYKWDNPEDCDVLPMWVADMDFKAAPEIRDALSRRVEWGIFGYSKVPNAYYDSIANWFARKHDWTINPEHILYTTGVVPAVAATLRALTEPGDKIVMQSPAYNCFYHCIENAGLELLDNKLRRDPATGHYDIDCEDLANKLADAKCKVLLLCNPHNPTGRLWSADELRRIAELCKANGVTVIADEIHCEFTYNGQKYTPFAKIAEEVGGVDWIVCNSASKSFNIAGLHIANIVIDDDQIRERVGHMLDANEVNDVSPFGIVGLMAAYNESEEWLASMLEYMWGNYEFARDFITEQMPQYKPTPLESTYLMWIDITPSGLKSQEFVDRMAAQTHLLVSPGCIYGDDDFIRFNLACPRERVADGLKRLKKFADSLN